MVEERSLGKRWKRECASCGSGIGAYVIVVKERGLSYLESQMLRMRYVFCHLHHRSGKPPKAWTGCLLTNAAALTSQRLRVLPAKNYEDCRCYLPRTADAPPECI